MVELIGNRGNFHIDQSDKLTCKLMMLFEGECFGVKHALEKYGYTEQRYYQLLKAYKSDGSQGLMEKKKGVRKRHVRTQTVTNQIIRQRFLDPFASSEVIAQKMRQNGYNVSIRSVERTITEYGLKKKLIAYNQEKKTIKRKLK